MHALDLLIADHNRCRGMFARFKDANANDDTDTMSSCSCKILQELEVHMTIEEEIFYPMVRETNDDISETVDEGEQEHHVAKLLLAEIKQLPDGSDEWVAKVHGARESVEHHIDEEEAELFPPLRNRIDKDVWSEMAERFEARKEELGAPARRQDRPHQGRAARPRPRAADPRPLDDEPGRAGRHRRAGLGVTASRDLAGRRRPAAAAGWRRAARSPGRRRSARASSTSSRRRTARLVLVGRERAPGTPWLSAFFWTLAA